MKKRTSGQTKKVTDASLLSVLTEAMREGRLSVDSADNVASDAYRALLRLVAFLQEIELPKQQYSRLQLLNRIKDLGHFGTESGTIGNMLDVLIGSDTLTARPGSTKNGKPSTYLVLNNHRKFMKAFNAQKPRPLGARPPAVQRKPSPSRKTPVTVPKSASKPKKPLAKPASVTASPEAPLKEDEGQRGSWVPAYTMIRRSSGVTHVSGSMTGMERFRRRYPNMVQKPPVSEQ
jgi:hypothetical protein